jgi:hemerythrin-like domain-containing protein
MIDPIAVWHAEHARFARLLDFIEEQTAAFHEGKDPDYELLRDVVYYLHHYGDRYHHPREDAAFERLIKHDANLKQQIQSLLQQHRVLASVSETLLSHLDNILEDVVTARAIVEGAASTYILYYRNHIGAEERVILPRAAKLLLPEEWAAVERTVPVVADPLFGEDVSARYRELRNRVHAAPRK